MFVVCPLCVLILFCHVLRYLSKCGDFFDYFVNSHLKRVEFNTNFPVLDFLSLFYKYTFKQPEIDSFCVCLMTWNVFLDHLLLTEGNRLPTMATKHSERYVHIHVYYHCIYSIIAVIIWSGFPRQGGK